MNDSTPDEPVADSNSVPAATSAAGSPRGSDARKGRDDRSRNGAAIPRGKEHPRAKKNEPEQGYEFADVVSGQLDQDEAADDLVPAKRVLQPQVETPKLHKVLAQAGLGSRLEMEQLILEGRISVNNEPAHVGQRIQHGDQVKVNGKLIRYRIDPPPPRVIAYHKPAGEVVTHDDPQNRPTVFRKLPRLMQGKWQSVGRLDLNTEGLLLFTSSGELANQLMHPRFGLEREYAVRVLGALSNEEKQRLLDGVQLDDGFAAFGSIEDGGGEGSNCWYRVTISEGRNREVRRMLEAVGHAVSRLIRIRYGAMMLPRGLKRGAWLELDERDIRALASAAGTGRARADESQVSTDVSAERASVRSPSGAQGRPGGGYGKAGNGAAGRAPQTRSGDGRGKGSGAGGVPGKGGQPDPMKTSVGYIGSDSLQRQRQDQKRSNGGPGPRRSGR
ncbi:MULTISPECIES: pseudouridine synthase [unclassified Acidovorax]|uniref:pseudouridine synthase n=1 Tax=unclassified Acidovorax TaxID=2684926 RepID=UPI00288317E2|nr:MULTISPECIES: pseudouridine synthase [unclassified Acidovorax]